MDRLEAREPSRGSRRTGPGPFIVLCLFALVPALVLYGVFAFADGRDDDNMAAPPPPSTIVDPPLPEEPLANGMLSFRRMPAVISRDANVDEFVSAVAGFTPELNERSCVAVSVDGQQVGAQNPDIAVIPASTQKIIVAAAALELLGDDHTYTTRVVAPAAPVNGVVNGNLVLVGGGDPVLSSDWYPTSNLERRPVFNQTSLDTLADRVSEAGITQINGSVVGDGGRYDDEFFAPGWGNGVAGLEGGPYDAVLVNDARVLGEDRRADEPNSAAAREFTRLLRDRGIVVSGEGLAGSASSLDSQTDIAMIDSAPLTAIVEEMLTNSDNNTAELLVKEIGVEVSPDAGGTRQAGLDAIAELLAEWDIDMTNIVLSDGSGLSMENRLTCAALLTVLQRSGPDDTIGAALPVAGESGTLSDVFIDHAVAGRLLGKTGTLNNPPFNADPPAVKALAGYLPIDGGGAVEYALVLNGPTISDQSEYRPVWDSFADVLDTYPSGPSPADLGIIG
ncbi:D-alanyl-D-alanine carboxypeptidase/D-alanyl-D-alanine endopeptidase [Ilumatobacter nonamiensis]|uniref:D-alanyl-D-alanine carboxypeptidase/D-alanyl-D-alanine endopeptidase n=1 Tax=Ilumatobacter nonamiensis TaxID=467093 RepID=UPI000590E7EC|nr:D-alanyl-D-alanine carboxypeptidase/D-alanyl-D-alanine-endopeptidase [Ilumatobacter nonamiensis]